MSLLTQLMKHIGEEIMLHSPTPFTIYPIDDNQYLIIIDIL